MDFPGWRLGSWCYEGDGKAESDCHWMSLYGPTFATGDIIGCCMNFQERLIFYTKNGQLLDIAFSDMTFSAPERFDQEDIYPSIWLSSLDDHVRVNFGQKSFLFNIMKYIKERCRVLELEL